MKKIVIIGTTGSGKTTFFTHLTGLSLRDLRAEVNRNVFLENKINDDFTKIDRDGFENSTTTVSMNAHGVYFARTRANQFLTYHDLSTVVCHLDDLDVLFPIQLIDTAGQERFNFMVEILLTGAHGVIILSDGSNMSSLEKVSYYIDKVKEYEQKQGSFIPIIICVNKSDLKEKGLYIGKEAIIRWLNDPNLPVFETTNMDFETFLLPLQALLSKIDGLPFDVQTIKEQMISAR